MPTTRSQGKAPEAWTVDLGEVRHHEPPRSPSIATRSTDIPHRPPSPLRVGRPEPPTASRDTGERLSRSPSTAVMRPASAYSPTASRDTGERLSRSPSTAVMRPASAYSPTAPRDRRARLTPPPPTVRKPASISMPTAPRYRGTRHSPSPPPTTRRPASISTPIASRPRAYRRSPSPRSSRVHTSQATVVENRARRRTPTRPTSPHSPARSIDRRDRTYRKPASVMSTKSNKKAMKAKEEVLRLKLQLAELELQRAEEEIDSEYEEDNRSKAEYVRSWVEDAPRPIIEAAEDSNKKNDDGRKSPSIKVEPGTEGLTTFVSQLTSAISALAGKNAATTAHPHPSISKVIMTLPVFGGAHTEWLSFKAMYETTKGYFNDVENTARLRRYLKGRALEAVNSELIGETNPDEIMKELELQFGRPDSIAQAEIDKLKILSRCTEAPKDICAFANRVRSSVVTLRALKKDHYLINAELLRSLTDKLPNSIRTQWYRAYTEKYDTMPDLKCFSEFISEHARYCSAFAPAESTTETRRVVQRTLTVQKNSEHTNTVKYKCKLCEREGHFVSDCEQFKKATQDKRWELAKRFALCFRCLRTRNQGHSCESRKCNIDGCSRTHHRLLHFKRNSNNEAKAETVASSNTNTRARAFLKIVPVRVVGPAGEVNTYALLDDGSTVSLIDEEIATCVGAKGKTNPLNIKAIGDTSLDLPKSRRVNVKLVNSENRSIKISARTVPNLQLTPQRVDKRDLKDCTHLKGLSMKLMYDTAVPRVLIGQDNWHLLIATETRRGPSYQPVASLTALGWVLHGARSRALGQRVHFINQVTERHEDINQQLKDYFALESLIVNPRRPKSDPEKQAEDLLKNSVTQLPEGHVQTALLWKREDIVMPDSYENAFRRLLSIERKLDRKPDLKEKYNTQMQELITKGYAEAAPQIKTPGRTWYLPHFDVYNPAKPNKTRIVHDAAAKSKGMSLNDYLLTGPDLLQSLPGVIMRFRRHRIAVSADIQEMFMQVRVRPEDRDALRYLWRGNSREGAPQEYRMKSIIFGAASSPCTAIFAKNWNAEKFQDRYPQAVEAIVKNHYMDDYLDSFESTEEAIRITTEVRDIHRRACFSLRKWISNEPDVVKHIEPEESQVTSNEVKLMNTEEKILGLIWEPNQDTLTFNMRLPKLPAELINKSVHTKREALKIVMSLYDPLGLASPITIKAKQILQEAWRQGTDWDEPLGKDLSTQWTTWLKQLDSLKHIKIPRSYPGYSDACDIQLHVFVDASELAYAAVAYWRIETTDGQTRVSLVTSKARVAPLKITSIPRLELQAAVLGTRIANAVKQEHGIEPQITYWTDSRTVLTWIEKGSRTYKPFVAHRLAEIEDSSKVADWRWLPSKSNIADAATRDVPVKFDSSHHWYQGPPFLYQPRECWPMKAEEHGIPETGEERINAITLSKKINLSESVPDVNRFSRWERLIRSTARVLQFIRLCRRKPEEVHYKRTLKNPEKDPDWRAKRKPTPKKKISNKPSHRDVRAIILTGEIIKEAEQLLIKVVQHQSFEKELTALEKSRPIENNSRLKNLPIELINDTIVLKSRIAAAKDIEDATKRPPILDGEHRITQLYIDFVHRTMHHSGTETVLNEVRQYYWVLRLRPTTKKIVKQCLKCRIRKAAPPEPATGDLPRARLAHSQRPFTYTGLDYFGPLSVTVGRQHQKRYVALFTSRAVHLEIAASLSADSCVMALRRFAARRGCPSEIYSDNGTNMHGADKEIIEALKNEAGKRGIVWRFITPSAPFMGGAWERLVRCVKTSLYTVLNERHPTEEILATLLCEVEYTVNSRPLTHVSVEAEEEEAITPNHILLGGSARLPNFGTFSEAEINDRKHWRRAQVLADMFWRRWVREYLPELQHRRVPHGTGLTFEVGDPVLIADGQLPRNSWPRGRITATYPGPDGQVRTVEVRTAAGTLKRPVKKLVPLPK